METQSVGIKRKRENMKQGSNDNIEELTTKLTLSSNSALVPEFSIMHKVGNPAIIVCSG